MPGFDGTGPSGRGVCGGQGLGPPAATCAMHFHGIRRQHRSHQVDIRPDEQVSTPLNGLGRGGIPRVCGRGFSGGRFRRA